MMGFVTGIKAGGVVLEWEIDLESESFGKMVTFGFLDLDCVDRYLLYAVKSDGGEVKRVDERSIALWQPAGRRNNTCLTSILVLAVYVHVSKYHWSSMYLCIISEKSLACDRDRFFCAVKAARTTKHLPSQQLELRQAYEDERKLRRLAA